MPPAVLVSQRKEARVGAQPAAIEQFEIIDPHSIPHLVQVHFRGSARRLMFYGSRGLPECVGIAMWNIDKRRLMLIAACAAITVFHGACTGQQSSKTSGANQKSGTAVPAVYGNLEQVMVGIMF